MTFQLFALTILPSTFFDLNAFIFTHIEQDQTAIGKHAIDLLLTKLLILIRLKRSTSAIG